MKNRIVIAACILLGLCPALLQAQDNDGINAIYERMSAAYAALDSQAFVDIYAADAAYLRSDENPMLTDIDAIIDNYERYFASVREGNGRLELLFRVIKRDCVESICSDVGWYKNSRYDSDGALEDTSYGRFLTTPGRSEDGMWRFVADLDTGAVEAHWNDAAEIAGLHFAE